jgi:flagellar biosynthesis/type III secretory pathway protein FliH
MDSVREAWTDERLDDLNHRVDEGFRETREEFRAVRAEMRAMSAETNARLDGLQRTMVQAVVAMTAAMLTGFVGLAALIVTQG